MSTRSWFSRALVPWYREHRRDLPWRRTRDPYRIWLSEVILQQTRVDQGLGYYERFVERFPTVADLAAAPDGEVMKLWQGLGYYSRARNLLVAARQVSDQGQGRFPDTLEGLRALKGVGAYTAAAIASIAFDRPAAVVDGNVYRVLARVFGIDTPIDSTEGRKRFAELAEGLLDPGAPGDHNQAVMELGATVCTPRDPACGTCPLATRCIARKEGRVALLPVKAGRTTVRERHFSYLILRSEGAIVLQQRRSKDIWQELHEPPLIESPAAPAKRSLEKTAGQLLGRTVALKAPVGPVKHVLSHQVIHATFWTVEPAVGGPLPAGCFLADQEALKRLAVPRLVERYLEEHFSPGPTG